MCRSIKTLRPPFTEDVTDDDVRAAALQYVRKLAGMRAPAPHNAAVFARAVDEVAAATALLLDGLVVRGAPAHLDQRGTPRGPGSSEPRRTRR